MTCDSFREALSARIDGEPAGLPDTVIDDHLARCSACHAWAAAAEALAGSARIHSAQAIPNLAADILRTARQQSWPAGDSSLRPLRWGLGLVALLQLVLTVSSVLAGPHVGPPAHVAHELGSWDLALAVGFLFAALHPARAWGLLPLVAALVGGLLLTTGIDIVGGNAALVSETTHVLEVIGLGLLWALARRPTLRREPRLQPA